MIELSPARIAIFALAISQTLLSHHEVQAKSTPAAVPSAYPIKAGSTAYLNAPTACQNLASTIPLQLAALPNGQHTMPISISNVIAQIYADGSNPSVTDLLSNVPAAAMDGASASIKAIAYSLGDWDSGSLQADGQYGLEDGTQARGGLPPFCRFGASIATSSSSSTWFEVWMPVSKNVTVTTPGTNNTAANTNTSFNSTADAPTQERRAVKKPHKPASKTTKLPNHATTSRAVADAAVATAVAAGAAHDNWHGRLVYLGTSGQRGSPSYPEMKQVLSRYREAAASSNMGHWGTGSGTLWSLNQPEMQNDYGFRATHMSALASQFIVSQFYNVVGGTNAVTTSTTKKTTKHHTTTTKKKHHPSPTPKKSAPKHHSTKSTAKSRKKSTSKHHKRGGATSANFYFGFPTYYKGCSTGGRQGMMEAQRFPYDFDGIIAGSPALYYNELNAYQIHVNYFQSNSSSPSYIPRSMYSTLHKFVISQCDALDGIQDAVIEDPSICNPNWNKLLCAPATTSTTSSSSSSSTSPSVAAGQPSRRSELDQSRMIKRQATSSSSSSAPSTSSASSAKPTSTYAPAGKCLTPAQIQNLQNIYSDYTYPSGQLIYEGMSIGSEGAWNNNGVDGSPFGPAGGWYQNEVLGQEGPFDPFTAVNDNFDLIQYGSQMNPGSTNTNNADLSAFFGKGGKLIHYHGLSDQLIPNGVSDRWYNAIRAAVPDISNYRYFHIPGMAHCRGGDGAWNFGGAGQLDDGCRPYLFNANYDMLLALFNWVEGGNAPDEIWGAGYKYTTGPEAKNHVTNIFDEQEYGNGLKFTHKFCNYPKKVKLDKLGRQTCQ